MATLRETLKGNRGLFQTSEEEIQKLAQRQQLTSAPTTPIEQKVIGANKDQAKMAGTPNQRISAMRQQFEADETLAGHQRRRAQPVSKFSPKEEAQKGERANLQNLGNLNDRVRQIALNRFKQEQPAPESLEFTEQLEDLSIDIQDRLAAGDATMEDYVQIAEQLGITDVADSSQLVSQVNQLLGVDTAASSEFIAELAAGDLKLGELTDEDITAMGYTDFSEIASSLGLTDVEAQQLSLDGLQDMLDAKQAEEFDRARTARNILRDPASTMAQRENARRELERLQAAGIDDMEAQFENIEKRIEEGQTIQCAGQPIHLDELLDNEYLELEIARALEDPDYMEKLREKEPEFAEFIEENQQMFSNLVDEISLDTQAFLDIQDQNAALVRPSEDMASSFSQDVMQTWYEDFGKLRGEVYEPNGVIQVMQDPNISAGTKQIIEEAIQRFSSVGNTDLVREMGELSKDEIMELGFNDRGQVERFTDNVQSLNALGEATDASEIEDHLYGPHKSTRELTEMLQEAKMLEGSGFGVIRSHVLNILDSNRDGKLDSLSDIKQRVLEQPTSLREMITQGKKLGDLQGARLDVPALKKATSIDNSRYERIKDYYKNDGFLTSEDVYHISKDTKLMNTDLEHMYNRGSFSGKAQKSLKMLMDRKAQERMEDYYSDVLKCSSSARRFGVDNVHSIRDK